MLLRTEKQLEAFASRFARRLRNPKRHALYPKPYVVALVGELGSGKTTFVRGFARGLGIRSRITSPTFIFARRHRIPRGKLEIRNSRLEIPPQWLWHFDLYRLHKSNDLRTIGFDEIISDPRNVVVVEWADRVRNAMPRGAIWIHFQHHPKGRTVLIQQKETSNKIQGTNEPQLSKSQHR